jgi:hypothetical protein
MSLAISTQTRTLNRNEVQFVNYVLSEPPSNLYMAPLYDPLALSRIAQLKSSAERLE